MSNSTVKVVLKIGSVTVYGSMGLFHGALVGLATGIGMRVAQATPEAKIIASAATASACLGFTFLYLNRRRREILKKISLATLVERQKPDFDGIPDVRFFRKSNTPEQMDQLAEELVQLKENSYRGGIILGSGVVSYLIG